MKKSWEKTAIERDNFYSVTGLDVGEIETECDFLRHRFSTTQVEKNT